MYLIICFLDQIVRISERKWAIRLLASLGLMAAVVYIGVKTFRTFLICCDMSGSCIEVLDEY